MEAKLSDEDRKWLIERQSESFLTWIGLWLVCLLGNVGILTTTVSNSNFSAEGLNFITALYVLLIAGMVFSVYRLANITKLIVCLASGIEEQEHNSLHDFMVSNRGTFSRFMVSDEGKIRWVSFATVVIVHFAVLLLFLHFAILDEPMIFI